MTAHADATPGTRKQSLWKDVREQPVFIVLSACLLFVLALSSVLLLVATERARTIIQIERVDLDRTASDPTSLVRTAPLSLDGERETLLSDSLIRDALKKLQGNSADALSFSSSNDGGLELSTLSATVLEDLKVKAAGSEASLVDVSLSPAAATFSGSADDIVNAIAASYVDLRNRERRRQKEQALNWANDKLASLQGTIETLTRFETTAPAAAETSSLEDPSQTNSETLLDFFIDATKSAQAETLNRMTTTVSTAISDQKSVRDLEVLEFDYATLQDDLKRLEGISLQTTRPARENETKPISLTNAEHDLVRFKKDLDDLMSSGILDSPAATIVQKALPTSSISMLQWNILAPAAAALSILVALALAVARSRWQAARTRQRASAGLEALSDPYWPMTPQQRQADLAGQPIN